MFGFLHLHYLACSVLLSDSVPPRDTCVVRVVCICFHFQWSVSTGAHTTGFYSLAKWIWIDIAILKSVGLMNPTRYNPVRCQFYTPFTRRVEKKTQKSNFIQNSTNEKNQKKCKRKHNFNGFTKFV